MKLRDYQDTLIKETRDRYKIGFKRPLVVLPCGGGKTVCFAFMADAHVNKSKSNFVLFLVHRIELVDQTLSTFKRLGIKSDQIFIGMVQSYKKYKDLEPTLIIFDEAHHVTSNTWYRVVDQWPEVMMVGLTATPKRLDGQSLEKVFDCIVEGPNARWLIDNKYLAPYKWFAPKSNLHLTEKGQDYDLEDITNQILSPKIYGDIALHLDPNKKTIIYSPSIKLSKELEKTFEFVRHFDGDTPPKERKQIIEDFRSGKIKALSNVDLIGEGFDVADCDCVMLLRPTKSLTLFIQQSMRCMRYAEGKTATVIDMVGNIFNFGFPTDYENWDLSGRLKPPNRNEVEEVLMRRCEGCLLVYPGIAPHCPYCSHDNHKTKRELKIEKEAELQEIKEMKVKERKKAYTLDQLKEIEKSRGYKNGWAYAVFKSRGGYGKRK